MQKAVTGGILAIVSSILGGLMGLVFLALPALVNSLGDFTTTSSDFTPVEMQQILTVIYGGIGVFFILLGALGLVGGIFAVNRRKFGLALAGAIASSISFYPLGIVAVILVSMARPDFNRGAAEHMVTPASPPV